jgi:ABC-type multidrug transport system fused ATPase/permease subunit
MLKSSDILLLDEATSALDSETELLIQSALNELMKHRTTVVIAHRLSTIMHADQVLVLEKGHVIEQGPPSQLLKDKSRFRDFYDLQADASKKRTGT